MEPKTYSEKLKDPRWQRKRLEILSRDNFTCRHCKQTEYTLHVHHLKYHKEPWDVQSEYLITLCEYCHESETKYRKEVEQILLDALRVNGFNYAQVHTLSNIFGNYISTDWASNEDNLLHLMLSIENKKDWDKNRAISVKKFNKEVGEYFRSINKKEKI